MSGLGALLGLAAGAGVWLVLAGVPARPALDRRLAPSLAEPAAAPARPWTAALAGAARGLDRVAGGPAGVRRRLAAVGDPRSVAEFRAEQLRWALAGLVLGGLAGTALTVASGRWSAPGLLAVAGAVAGGLASDLALTRRVRRRQAAVLAELPVVSELLALAVTAGEGLAGALDRVCRLTTGTLPAELAGALARGRAGAPLATALAELRDRAGLPALARFLDGVLVAVERGTPLAEVLRAQAADVREAGTRALLESGGRREIAMLVPVVFGILPTTVIFVLYPGLAAIATLTALG